MSDPIRPEQTVSIDRLYNGGVNVAHGGYICGLLASFVDGDAEVRINSGFPVATPLLAVPTDKGGVEVYLRDRQLGSARPTTVQLDIPGPPDYETARRASENFVFLHNADVNGCFACSPLRTPDRGLRIFIGALPDIATRNVGENLTAAVWRPTPNLAASRTNRNLGNSQNSQNSQNHDSNDIDNTNYIDNTYVWSALDCPGVYALKLRYPASGILVLGSCAASIKRPLAVDQHYIVSSWQIAPTGGRKLHMGVAIHSMSGELMACAKQICFDVGDSLPGPPE